MTDDDSVKWRLRAYCEIADTMMASATAFSRARPNVSTGELVVGGAAVALAYAARVMRVPATEVLDDVRRLTLGFFDAGGDPYDRTR